MEGVAQIACHLGARRMDEKASSTGSPAELTVRCPKNPRTREELAMSKHSVRKTIGVDLGDRRSTVCVLEDGNVVKPKKRRRGGQTISTTKHGFTNYFGRCEPCRVVIEAGTHSPWVSESLAAMGHEVIVANARRVRLISHSEKKSDDRDAELLARLGSVDVSLLSPIEHRGAEARQDRTLLRVRDVLVRNRTGLVNAARGLAKSSGERIPSGFTPKSFATKVRAAAELSSRLRELVEPLLAAIDDLNSRIKECDRQIDELVKKYPIVGRLEQIAGVGKITALAFVLTVEDPLRFIESRKVGAYFGLVPRKSASGQRDPELRITKCGDSFVRRLLVCAAHYILGPFGPDTDLRRWGLALAARGKKNAKKRAVVAVARKLAVLLHRLWITGEEYEPLRNSQGEL